MAVEGAAAEVVHAPEPTIAADVTPDGMDLPAGVQVETSAAHTALDDMPMPAEGQVHGARQ